MILKMKKLRLVALRSRKEELLRDLIQMGCVEFREIESEIQGTEAEGLVTRESSEMMRLKSQHAALTGAVTTLGKYVPVKSKLLAPKPECEGQTLLDDSDLEAAMRDAEAIEGAEDRIRRIAAEESRQRGVIESLVPWLPLDADLGVEGTGRCAVMKGSIPGRVKLDEVDAALRQINEEAELFRVSADKNQNYVFLLCMKEDLPAMQECLRSFGFSASAVTGMNGTARECTAAAEQTIRDLAAERADCVKTIESYAARREAMMLAADKVAARMSMAEAEERCFGTEQAVVMEGWIPEEREEELGKVFDKYDCAWETAEPEEGEYPTVPVELKNNNFTNSLNMVTNMYSLPAYGTVDPNPLMAPFFILFFGLMMADLGYGLLMTIGAIVIFKTMKPRGGTRVFAQLLLYGGISTALCGVITGGFFSDAIDQVVRLVSGNPQWTVASYIPGWGILNPQEKSIAVLVGSLVLGLIHMNVGMAVNFVMRWKKGDKAGAIFEEGAQWLILLTGILWALSMDMVEGVLGFKVDIGNINGIPVPLCAALLMMLYGAGREAKGFGKITAAFGCIYNFATGWFGDILSYSRIMALMLAGGVIGQVFNTVAIMPAQNAGKFSVISVIVFILIFLVGHALNFGLNILGCFVHDLRLQCLEFFGKFYQDGGKPFRPLKFNGKFYQVKEN